MVHLSPEYSRFKQFLLLFGLTQQASALEDLTLPDQSSSFGNNFVFFGNQTRSSQIMLNSNFSSSLITKLGSKQLKSGLIQDSTTRSLALAEDINGDGKEDLMIGDPVSSIVYVLYGEYKKNDYYESSKGFRILGRTANDYFGWSVSEAGDFNGDVIGDLVISALTGNKVYMIYGRKGRPTSDVLVAVMSAKDGIIISGSKPLTSIGMSVSSAGDFNGDGLSDVMLSAVSSGRNQNFIYLIFGNTSHPETMNLNILGESMIFVANSADFAGTVLSDLGDVNGDGVGDIGIGSLPRGGTSSVQKTIVVYGSTSFTRGNSVFLDDLSGKQGFQILGAGFGVCGIGDIDGDGMSDIMVNSFNDWSGRSATYIMVPPVSLTSSPSFSPSFSPMEDSSGSFPFTKI